MRKNLIKNQLNQFKEYLIVKKGFQIITAKGYARTISIAIRRMKKLVPKYKEIKKLIIWMNKKNYSYSHILNTILAIEKYSEFKNKPIKLGRPKKPKRIIKNTLREAEINRLIQSSNTIRKKAIITTLAYSGIRNQEIRNLSINDFNPGTNELIIRQGKNKKDRIVNISSQCTNILLEYIQIFKPTSYLFTTLKRKQLASQDLRKIVKVIAKKAKINKRVYPHLFRHSLATNMLKRGANIILIKDQLGHAFIETTMIYITSNPFLYKSEYEFYKPAYI